MTETTRPEGDPTDDAAPADLGWFRRPSGDHPGTLNACFVALDRQVVRGRSSDLAVGEETFAVLVELVGALAGALQGWGAAPGTRVLLDVAAEREAVLLALACARLGAVVVTAQADHLDVVRQGAEPVVVASDRAGAGVLLNDVAWDLTLKAGRTDPAGCADVLADAPFVVTWTPEGAVSRSVLQVSGELAAAVQRAPLSYLELRKLLHLSSF